MSCKNFGKLNQPLRFQSVLYLLLFKINLNKNYIFIGFLLIALQYKFAEAVTIQSSASGFWNTGTNWSLGRKPTCGDTVIISSGKTVTVNTQDNLSSCGAPLIIYVSGTFQFTNGNKLDLPCGSWVYLKPGGIVKKSTAGGGNSTLISICGYIEWNAGDGQISGIDTLGGHGSLPVTWLALEASLTGKKVNIDWSTASEINNDYFEIMRSADGLVYVPIGKIDGNGNSTVVNYYSFNDLEPEAGINYYKLNQVDFDGRVNPSDVIAVYNPDGIFGIDAAVLAPNPVTSSTLLQFNSAQSSTVSIEIKNGAGQIYRVFSRNVTKGINSFSIDQLSQLPKGVYSLTIYTGKGSCRPLAFIKD